MQVVILAGGQGTRLWPLTKEVPKPMVPVAGMPYLEHQIRMLQRQGFSHFLLLTGYLAEQIEEHFGDGSRLGISVRYSREHEPLGTAGGLRDAASLLFESFLLLYGDSYLPIDYQEVARQLDSDESAVGLMVVYDNAEADTSVRNNVALKGGRVLLYEKEGPNARLLTHVEAGVLAFRKSVLDSLPRTGKASLEQDVYPKLAQAGTLLGFQTRQRFYDIGTPERLRVIAEVLTR